MGDDAQIGSHQTRALTTRIAQHDELLAGGLISAQAELLIEACMELAEIQRHVDRAHARQ